jgi:hypothetical protein
LKDRFPDDGYIDMGNLSQYVATETVSITDDEDSDESDISDEDIDGHSQYEGADFHPANNVTFCEQ